MHNFKLGDKVTSNGINKLFITGFKQGNLVIAHEALLEETSWYPADKLTLITKPEVCSWKYGLYHMTIEDGQEGYTLFNEVEMTPYQMVHLKSAGFSFAKRILEESLDSPALVSPMVVIGDDNNWFAKIYPWSRTLKECLTSGAKIGFTPDNQAQLDTLFSGTEQDEDGQWTGTAHSAI